MNQKYITELFDSKRHKVKDFTCGIQKLDNYLKEKASQEIKKNISAVYVLREISSFSVLGYFTLSSSSIELIDLPKELAKKLPKYKSLPVILLGRLALDKSFQGKGIGEYLLMDVLERSLKLSNEIGSYAVIVDAKDKNICSFYKKYGFIQFLHRPLKLYLPISTIKQLLK